MEPASEEDLNNPPIVRLATRPGIINRSGEERFPDNPIINRPSGEAVPKNEKRLRSDRPHVGRGPEATIRLPDP